MEKNLVLQRACENITKEISINTIAPADFIKTFYKAKAVEDNIYLINKKTNESVATIIFKNCQTANIVANYYNNQFQEDN